MESKIEIAWIFIILGICIFGFCMFFAQYLSAMVGLVVLFIGLNMIFYYKFSFYIIPGLVIVHNIKKDGNVSLGRKKEWLFTIIFIIVLLLVAWFLMYVVNIGK